LVNSSLVIVNEFDLVGVFVENHVGGASEVACHIVGLISEVDVHPRPGWNRHRHIKKLIAAECSSYVHIPSVDEADFFKSIRDGLVVFIQLKHMGVMDGAREIHYEVRLRVLVDQRVVLNVHFLPGRLPLLVEGEERFIIYIIFG